MHLHLHLHVNISRWIMHVNISIVLHQFEGHGWAEAMHTPCVGHLQNSVGCFRHYDFFLAKYARVIDTDVFWIEETPINCVQQFIDPIFGNYLYRFFFFLWISAVQPKPTLKLIDLVKVEQRSRTRHPKSNLDWIFIFITFL